MEYARRARSTDSEEKKAHALPARLGDGVEGLGAARDEGHGALGEEVALPLRLRDEEDARVGPDDRLPHDEEGGEPVLAGLPAEDEDGAAEGEEEVGDR